MLYGLMAGGRLPNVSPTTAAQALHALSLGLVAKGLSLVQKLAQGRHDISPSPGEPRGMVKLCDGQ